MPRPFRRHECIIDDTAALDGDEHEVGDELLRRCIVSGRALMLAAAAPQRSPPVPSGDVSVQQLGRRRLFGLGLSALIGTRVLAALPVGASGGPFGALRLRQLEGGFSEPIGAWLAGDIPHAHPLPDGRIMWLLNDSFIATDATGDIATSRFVRNTAISQRGNKFALLESSRSFQSTAETTLDRWWWFHGGVVNGANLLVVTTEMVRIAPISWSINFEPRSTWITTIDWTTNEIVDMSPAPNSGVLPVYGFSIASDTVWTYLYGNNHLYGRQTTENWVARVPLGQLHEAPQYWTGRRWSPNASQASSILSHGEYACRLSVLRHGSRWLGVAKDEEFTGTDILLFESPGPVGPWVLVNRIAVPTKTGDDQTCTYDATAHSVSANSLLVWWSNNAYTEALFRSQPSIYRPTFAAVRLT